MKFANVYIVLDFLKKSPDLVCLFSIDQYLQ